MAAIAQPLIYAKREEDPEVRDRSSSMTGTDIVIDGGLVMTRRIPSRWRRESPFRDLGAGINSVWQRVGRGM
jgi:hypothetical protein